MSLAPDILALFDNEVAGHVLALYSICKSQIVFSHLVRVRHLIVSMTLNKTAKENLYIKQNSNCTAIYISYIVYVELPFCAF